jgi:hypothetical protein
MPLPITTGALSAKGFGFTSAKPAPTVYWTQGFTGFANTSQNIMVGSRVVGSTIHTSIRSNFLAPQVIYLSKINANTGVVSNVTSWSFPGTTTDYNVSYDSFYVDASSNYYIVKANSGGTYVTKMDSSGTIAWTVRASAQFYGTDTYSMQGMSVDSGGNLYILGIPATGTPANVLIKLNSSGTLQWAKRFFPNSDSGSSGPRSIGLWIDGSDRIWAFYNSSSGTTAKGYVTRWDTAGSFVSGRVFTGSSPGSPVSVLSAAVNSSGNMFITVGSSFDIYNSRVNLLSLDSSYTQAFQYDLGPTLPGFTQPVLEDSNTGYVFTGASYISSYQPGILWIGTTSGTTNYQQRVSPSPTGAGQVSVNTNFYQAQTLLLQANKALFLPVASSTAGTNYRGMVKIPLDGVKTGLYPFASNNRGLFIGDVPSSVSSATNISIATPPTSTISDYSVTFSTATNPTSSSASGSATLNTTIATTTSPGSRVYTVPGTYSWVAPTGVTSASIVVVGGGGGGDFNDSGGGGALAYTNAYSVTPSSSYTVVVGAGGNGSEFSATGGGCSSFVSTGVLRGGGGGAAGAAGGVSGGTSRSGGGAGGNGASSFSGGGGGAGGYAGAGGHGGNPGSAGAGGAGGGGAQGSVVIFCCCAGVCYSSSGWGGGVGPVGQGTSGSGGAACSGATGGAGSCGVGVMVGGGGAYGGLLQCFGAGTTVYRTGYPGGNGIVRIVYPGNTRQFPSTDVAGP